MKNNTKIRLHLSKQLFETLTKQVLAEAKVNDGYSETVKQPKGGAVKENAPKMPPVPPSKPKMPPVPASKPKVPPVPPLKPKMPPVPSSKPKMPPVPGKMEEKMSSKEKMAKGLYKEDAGALQPGDNVTWKDGSQREYKGVVDAHEEGDYYKVKITAAPAGGHKEGSIITKQSGDLSKDMAEGSLNEMGAEWEALLTAAGVAGAGITSYGIMKVQDYLKKKFPKQYADAAKVRGGIGKANPGLDV